MHLKNQDPGSPQRDRTDASSDAQPREEVVSLGTQASPAKRESASEAELQQSPPSSPFLFPPTPVSTVSPPVATSPNKPSLFTTMQAQDMDKKVKQVAGMFPRRLQHSPSVKFLFSMHSLEMQLGKVLACDTAEELLAVRDQINNGRSALASFTEACKAAAKSLRTACTQAKKQVDGQASREQAKAADQEGRAVRKQAEEARLAVEARAREVPATYKLHNVFPQVAVSTCFTDAWDPAKPCIIKKDSVMHLDELRHEPVVQLMFASFCSSHIKLRHSWTRKCTTLQSAQARASRR